MKPTKNLFIGLAALCLAGASSAFLTSCDDEQFEGSISGQALMTTTQNGQVYAVSSVHDGDKVQLQIGATEGTSMSIRVVTISGIDYAPDVHYLIDGQEVGVSHDHATAFSMPYEIHGLSAGRHTLSVRVDKDFGNIDYTVNVAPSVFEVE